GGLRIQGDGHSRMTSAGSLSVRRPRKTGWRKTPSVVHSVNFTSTTTSGSTHTGSLSRGGISANGLVSRRTSRSSRASGPARPRVPERPPRPVVVSDEQRPHGARQPALTRQPPADDELLAGRELVL